MNEDRLRILIVDDDEDDYVLTRGVLAEIYGNGLEVEWASTYDQARPSRFTFDVSICLKGL